MVLSFPNCGRNVVETMDTDFTTRASELSVTAPAAKSLATTATTGSCTSTTTRFFAEKNVHDIPSEKMNGLSAQERIAGFYDLHGVTETLTKEVPTLISEKLHEMDVEMFLVNDKMAYYMAKVENEDYVKSLRLRFLRAENLDAPKAARRMARHFQFRLTMFGTNVLGRDIRLSDLPEFDRTLFEKGFMQIGLERDRAGRAMGIQMLRKLGSEPPPETAARLFFFCMCVLGSHERTQKKGVILLEYMVGIRIEQLLSTNRRARTPLFLNVVESMPVRLNALHVCFDDPRIRGLFRLLTAVIEGRLLCRLQSHFGTDLECLYSLMAFGIPPSCLPIQPDGRIDTTHHLRILSELAANDVGIALPTCGVSILNQYEEEADPPSAEDVLMGRGKHGKKWPGNLRLRRLVERRRDDYKAADRDGKIAISQAIYKELIDSGSRFLAPSKHSSELESGWVDRPKNEVCLRIAHMFRNLRAAERTQGTEKGSYR